MQASAPTRPLTEQTFALPRQGPTGKRELAAFKIIREVEGPALPLTATELATTDAPLPPGSGGSTHLSMDPRCFRHQKVHECDGRKANTAFDFFAHDITAGWGPNVHIKLAARCQYKRRCINHDKGPFLFNRTESNGENAVVLLVALPTPREGYDGQLRFRVPRGLRMELDALHDDHRSFMRSWEAVDDAELVVVDPELLKVPDRPWWETFDPCGECAPTVSNWPADAGFAERAISLCGPCYTVYKDLKQAPSKDRPPPQRVSPYVLALDRSLVPLNAEMAKMDVVRVSHKGYPAVLLFSFH